MEIDSRVDFRGVIARILAFFMLDCTEYAADRTSQSKIYSESPDATSCFLTMYFLVGIIRLLKLALRTGKLCIGKPIAILLLER